MSSPTGIGSRRRVLGPTTDPSLTEWMFHQSVSYDVCVCVCVCVCVHVCVCTGGYKGVRAVRLESVAGGGC